MTVCKDCKYYKERHFDYNGWCRAHPPVWDKKFEVCNFPTGMADYWCGEFVPIEPVTPAFDTEKVRKLIRNHLEAARDYGSHYPESSAKTLGEDGTLLRNTDIALRAALGIDE